MISHKRVMIPRSDKTFPDFILNHHYSMTEVKKVNARRPETQRELYHRLSLAKELIDTTFTASVSLDDLAHVACMGSYHLLRQFKSLFGATPHQYLIEKRMDAANSLLMLTDKPVSEICSEVGYEDISSFSKLFKSRFGLSPANFRSSKRKEKAINPPPIKSYRL